MKCFFLTPTLCIFRKKTFFMGLQKNSFLTTKYRKKYIFHSQVEFQTVKMSSGIINISDSECSEMQFEEKNLFSDSMNNSEESSELVEISSEVDNTTNVEKLSEKNPLKKMGVLFQLYTSTPNNSKYTRIEPPSVSNIQQPSIEPSNINSETDTESIIIPPSPAYNPSTPNYSPFSNNFNRETSSSSLCVNPPTPVYSEGEVFHQNIDLHNYVNCEPRGIRGFVPYENRQQQHNDHRLSLAREHIQNTLTSFQRLCKLTLQLLLIYLLL